MIRAHQTLPKQPRTCNAYAHTMHRFAELILCFGGGYRWAGFSSGPRILLAVSGFNHDGRWGLVCARVEN
jgi:hypothetical protein